MRTDTAEKILKHIRKRGLCSAKELYDFFPFSQRAIFKQLKGLREKGLIMRQGAPPRVLYELTKKGEMHFARSTPRRMMDIRPPVPRDD